MVDKEQLLGDDDKMEELPVANIPGLTSPQRRDSLMEEDLPGDDDVLATLLGLYFHWNSSVDLLQTLLQERITMAILCCLLLPYKFPVEVMVLMLRFK